MKEKELYNKSICSIDNLIECAVIYSKITADAYNFEKDCILDRFMETFN